MSNFLTDLWRNLKDADTEARAEMARRNKLVAYDPRHFDTCTHSPVEFYNLILKNLDWRKVPDLSAGLIWLRERHVFSKQRLYLQLKRERLVFEICAAPFGTGYFVSSRLFDRRRSASPWHYISVLLLMAGIAFVVMIQYGWIMGEVVTIILFTTVWSLMRLAVHDTAVWLDEKFSELPILGPIYETLFHPDTYYRQDTNAMYSKVVKKAFNESIDELVKLKGLKVSGDDSPILLEKLEQH